MPKVITWWIAVILGIIGIIFAFLPSLQNYAIWSMALGWILLVLGTAIKGL